MVFSSLPLYLDPPNWNQHPAPNQAATCGGGGGDDDHQLPAGAAAQRPEAAPIRPGSMAERARLAKIPQPEPALKCPRCDSTNTKFCYFNNYSLSQPRHFCKTCRRYWTRGGALRNVPVGGGCRRNKRSKAGGGSSSKSQLTGGQSGASSSSTATSGGGAFPSNMLMPTQLPFMSSLHSLAEYSNSMGMNFSSIQLNDTVEFQLGNSPGLGLEQWRIQQFPFLGSLDPPMSLPLPPPVLPVSHGLFQFDDVDGFSAQSLPKGSSSGLITQFASVKMEDNAQGLSLPMQYLGIPGNDQYNWGISGGGSSGGGGWLISDLSNFNAPSSSNLL